MKKFLLFAFAMIAVAIAFPQKVSAQKFALVDMEYILSKIPAYEMASQQLDQFSQRMQKEVEAKALEAEKLYKDYQAEMVYLTADQKKAREAQIVTKEKEVSDLRTKYFGPEGDLFNVRQKLMEPIQESIYEAVKKVAEERGYECIFDRASSSDIIFASPRIDVSSEVLDKLGYSK
ncbi:MAG: OmpH family outer membrane protein [Paramuribaculum sp.]|nr:OmpH family outer membrane protein [Paramuribaculum sp.]